MRGLGGELQQKKVCKHYSMGNAYRVINTRNMGKLEDIGLVSFARGSVKWEGDHVTLVPKPKDSMQVNTED